MSPQSTNNTREIVSYVDLLIFKYLHKKKEYQSIYEIVKGTIHENRLKKPEEFSYDTVKSHCENLAIKGLIDGRKNPNPRALPRVKYKFKFEKLQVIRDMIEKQKKLNAESRS
jgi:hypothetical protein